MVGKLYILTSPVLKSCFRSNYFLCIGQKELYKGNNFNMKQFVNIKSGTIVESAIWKLGYDIEEAEITEESQLQIKKILNTNKLKRFLQEIENYYA